MIYQWNLFDLKYPEYVASLYKKFNFTKLSRSLRELFFFYSAVAYIKHRKLFDDKKWDGIQVRT
jgi:hypothetical protein